MPAVDVDQFARADIELRHEDRHEHHLVVVLTQLLIGKFHDVCEIVDAAHDEVFQDRLRDHHEQRGGNAFTAHVRNRYDQVIVVEHVEVVEIASDLARRIHCRVYVKLFSIGERRKYIRQHRLLNVHGNVELGCYAFLLRRRRLQIAHVFFELVGHCVKTDREALELVAGVNVEFFVEIAGTDLAHAVRELMYRFDEVLRLPPPDIRCCNQQYDDEYAHEHHRLHHVIVEFGNAFFCQALDQLGALNDRLGDDALLDCRRETPIRLFDRRERHVILLAVDCRLAHALDAFEHLHGDTHELGIVMQTQIVIETHGDFARIVFGINAFVGRENDAPEIVDDEAKTALVHAHLVDDGADPVERRFRSGHSREFAAAVEIRHGAKRPEHVHERKATHVGEDQLLFRRRAAIPIAVDGIVNRRNDGTLFRQQTTIVVGTQREVVFRGDEHRLRHFIRLDRPHEEVANICRQFDLALERRPIEILRVLNVKRNVVERDALGRRHCLRHEHERVRIDVRHFGGDLFDIGGESCEMLIDHFGFVGRKADQLVLLLLLERVVCIECGLHSDLLGGLQREISDAVHAVKHHAAQNEKRCKAGRQHREHHSAADADLHLHVSRSFSMKE